jgi:Bacteriocin-protection, YdeI or OmpD-Associated
VGARGRRGQTADAEPTTTNHGGCKPPCSVAKPHDRAVIVPSGHEALYRGPMSSPRVPGGVVHKLPGDLRQALVANRTALDAWKDITPLARNEFICWVEDAKQEMTRERRIRRTQEELEEGQRRPCCWPGCGHRERTGR